MFKSINLSLFTNDTFMFGAYVKPEEGSFHILLLQRTDATSIARICTQIMQWVNMNIDKLPTLSDKIIWHQTDWIWACMEIQKGVPISFDEFAQHREVFRVSFPNSNYFTNPTWTRETEHQEWLTEMLDADYTVLKRQPGKPFAELYTERPTSAKVLSFMDKEHRKLAASRERS